MSPKRILVVDDDPFVSASIRMLLVCDQHETEIAGSGSEALIKLETQSFDLVLTDYMMPGMNGAELAHAIKQKNGSPPVVLSTGCLPLECWNDTDIDFVLLKPFSQENLRNIIAEAVALGLFRIEWKNVEGKPRIDVERFIELAGGNEANFNELVTQYLSQTALQLTQINRALGQADTTEAAIVAHRCAGASATCGMVAIDHLLQQLEFCAKAGDLLMLPKLLQAAKSELDHIRHFFENREKPNPSVPSSPSSV